jgi:hypothetical protein
MMQFLKPRVLPPFKLLHFSQTPSFCVCCLRIESNLHTHIKRIKLFFLVVQQLHNGPGPPHYRSLTIILRHATLCRTSLDE